MRTHSLTLTVQEVPPIMKRGRHVLILLQDQNHHFVLGKKNIYPPNISRMVGGGVNPGEAYHRAAARELYEELHYHAEPKDLTHLALVKATVRDQRNQVFLFETAIYFAQIKHQLLLPDDDLDGLTRCSRSEYLALIHTYHTLPKTLDPSFGFSWYDYGQLYGELHQIAWEAWQELQQKKTQV